ncbi:MULTISPECIES: TRAP transporter small permease [unclassified Agarivorans]|uniref:TRAP transporter small permease n=1 Tax=unclassified Agarivorans TaxID=2636026 RepID=UPI0010CF86AC|nr:MULTISPECIES: TRAP transporter small permease [unclassified Agarivorans]MDO6686508.1 TRAP transporter small permease [Agarivorans sp. 3_MG-2023]MDO6715326.1 TRAP transporter small permease [Agarivorans sp. 2_MG-2023]MDO6763357.1 TRAP transporter small permease [Agarivorans sp. 1_MG-2023]GDY26209.1 C4-dicarboxylate ABC transporter permease [Agarivorans sp. Toyoura001]
MVQPPEHFKLSKYDQFLEILSRISMWIAGVALVVLTATFGWLVFGRYVLNSTPTWVEQLSLLLVVLIAFLGASVGIHKNTHLGVSFFRDKSPFWLQQIFQLISQLSLAIFGCVMMVNSYQLMQFKWGSNIPLLGIPEGVRAIPIMLCGGLVLLYSIGHLIHLFQQVKAAFKR